MLKEGPREAFRVYDEHAFMSCGAAYPAEPLGLTRIHPQAVFPAEHSAASAGRRSGGRAIRRTAAVLALGAGAGTVAMGLVAQRLGPGDAPVAQVLTRRVPRSMGPRSDVRVRSSALVSELSGTRRAARTQASRRLSARARRTGRARQKFAGGVADRTAVATNVSSGERPTAVLAGVSGPGTGAPSIDGGARSRGEFGFER